MGGYESLRFYQRHPEKVSALIVMDTGPGYRNPARREEWNSRQEERAIEIETQGLSAIVSGSLHHSAVGLAHMGRKVVAQHDSLVIESLERIDVPTLVLVGENDTPFLAAADYMERTIPGAKRVTIPNAGHPANRDNIEAFNAAVLGFLRSLDLPSA